MWRHHEDLPEDRQRHHHRREIQHLRLRQRHCFQQAVTEALDGLPPHKIHCSVLAEEAVQAAIADYRTRNGLPTDDIPSCNGCCGGCHSHDHGHGHDEE